MVLIDVNILINAHRKNQERHKEFHDWLEAVAISGQMFSIPSMVRSAFLRIVTNPRIYPLPTPLAEAIAVLDEFLAMPNHVEALPGNRHWGIFTDLCRKVEAKGNLVADAYLAALAIESGGEWITADRDYARFPGLKWRHPLDAPYGARGPTRPRVEEPRSPYRDKKRGPHKK
jgi:toxin-antitoxin system PIN domain toxin